MTRLIFIASLCVLNLLANSALAFKFTPETCQKYGLGKNWYCENFTQENKQEISSRDIIESSLLPEEKAYQLNQLWEKQRQRAVMTASKQDIEKFLETHNLIINKGIDFAKITQNLIENSPILANSESYYKNLSDQKIKEQEKDAILANAHKRYGLVFIYSSTCPHCHRQLPIILSLLDKHKLKGMGISVDGNYFADLNENIVDENIVNDTLVHAFPTILLLDKKHPAKIFISKGLTSLDTLEEKIARRITERENEEN
jgi:conjugal transfer pilus assembly protein TraF